MSPLPNKFPGVYTCVSHMFRWMKMSDANLLPLLYLVMRVQSLRRDREESDAWPRHIVSSKKKKKMTHIAHLLFLSSQNNTLERIDEQRGYSPIINKTTKKSGKVRGHRGAPVQSPFAI